MSRTLVFLGSTNPSKQTALTHALEMLPLFGTHEIRAVPAHSSVRAQPQTLTETIQGALNRAEQVMQPDAIAVGIEDGLFEVPLTETGFMNVCACVILHGQKRAIGLSPGFEHPPEAVDLVLRNGLDISQAYYQLQLSPDENVGGTNGAIGVLSGNVVTRTDYTVPAILMALLTCKRQIENV